MKTILFSFIILCLSNNAFTQVYGELMMDKREVISKIEFTVDYSKPGRIVFDIAVDMDGNVTSCELNEDRSTVTATGAVMKGKSKIVQQLKFERGYHFPKFHYGQVQLNTVKSEKPADDKFAPPPF